MYCKTTSTFLLPLEQRRVLLLQLDMIGHVVHEQGHNGRDHLFGDNLVKFNAARYVNVVQEYQTSRVYVHH